MQYYPSARSGATGGVRRRAAPPIPFFLCNCHLFWDPKFSDVKLVQALQLLLQIRGILMMLPVALPLIICGDFNSEPNSAVYELMSTGRVSPNHPTSRRTPSGSSPAWD